jgi:hypothetical protein
MYLAFARYKYPGPSPQVISADTELVIDGYTRAGTTFAVYALQLAQERPVRLAHHLHAPAQVIEAARRGIPALVVIREPKSTILSQVIREPGVTIEDALVAYARFYSCLMPYRGNFIVAEFKQITNEFGAVVRRLNSRFGTGFAEFVYSEDNLVECSELMKLRGTHSKILLGFESGDISRDQVRRELHYLSKAKPVEARDAWVPSEDRERAKAALEEEWNRPRLARLRDRAQEAYQTFAA